MSRPARLGVTLLALALTSIFFVDFCGLVYQCGCRSLWAGAAAHCNIHGPGPHCPWCSLGSLGSTLVFLWVIIPQAAIGLYPSRLSLWKRLGITLLAFPVLGGIAALTLGIYKGYWTV